MDLPEVSYVFGTVLILLWLHSKRVIWGQIPFTCGLAFVLVAVWILEQQYRQFWLADHLFLTIQAMLVLDYLLEKTANWRWKVLLTTFFGVLLAGFDYFGLNLLGTVPEQSFIGLHSALLLATAVAIWTVDLRLKNLGLSRIMILLTILVFATWLSYRLFARGYNLETSALVVLTLFVVMAWYLERINPHKTMPAAQLAAYQNLLGTLEQLANPSKTSNVSGGDLVTTFFGTARVMASGSHDSELWSRLLNTAVLLVPGAEGGSLRLRVGNQFQYVAQQGYSEHLYQILLSEQNARAWHGDVLAWHRGEPRMYANPK